MNCLYGESVSSLLVEFTDSMIVLEIYEEFSSVVRRDDFTLLCNLEISSYVLDSELWEIKFDGLLLLTLSRHIPHIFYLHGNCLCLANKVSTPGCSSHICYLQTACCFAALFSNTLAFC